MADPDVRVRGSATTRADDPLVAVREEANTFREWMNEKVGLGWEDRVGELSGELRAAHLAHLLLQRQLTREARMVERAARAPEPEPEPAHTVAVEVDRGIER